MLHKIPMLHIKREMLHILLQETRYLHEKGEAGKSRPPLFIYNDNFYYSIFTTLAEIGELYHSAPS